jgi:hypothetical protein
MDLLTDSRRRHSRRDILKSSALAIFPLALGAGNSSLLDQQPMTANGGADPYPIPWLDKNGSHNQPAGANLEPSHIYHFKGRVARCSTFTGVGTDNQGNRIAFGSPTTDYGVMQGEFWGARAAQQGAFTHIWLTLFRGPAVPANQIHDFHPPIAPSGLYWVVPVPERGLTISPDGNTFTLEMQDVPVVDQPRWPALDSIAAPARMTFKMVWKSTGEPVRYEDPSKHFRFIGTRASCQLEAQVEVPSVGFSWKSDPLNTSKSDFAILGDEVNGRYYDNWAVAVGLMESLLQSLGFPSALVSWQNERHPVS